MRVLCAALALSAVCAQAASQADNQPLKPIARWTTVPGQRIDPGQVLHCGVVAFSKNGIAEVQFTIVPPNGGEPKTVSVAEMSLNEQTGVYEYWIPIACDDFIGDGPIMVEARVHGLDGGVRDKDTDGGGLGLDPLALVVNPTAGLVQVQAWVSQAATSDTDGRVNDEDAPFATIGGAIDAIRRFRRDKGLGDNADGGIVRLVPSEVPYVCKSNQRVPERIVCETHWLTITTARGASREEAMLTAPGWLLPAVQKLRLQGITLLYNASFVMSEPQWCSVWVDDCTLIGDGRGQNGGHPLLWSTEFRQVYYTDSLITELGPATSGAAMCRGLNIRKISDDAFQNVPLVVNCRVDDVHPLGPDGTINEDTHADCWQHFNGNDVNKRDDNVIVYGLYATNLGYQNIFIRGDIQSRPSCAQGMAFVNVYMDSKQAIQLQNRHGQWSRWVDHLLWWNCTLVTQGICFANDDYYYDEAPHDWIGCRIKNFSCIGSDFAFLRLDGDDDGIDWSGWEFNHFVHTEEHRADFITRGSNFTTGENMLDLSGTPLGRSPLLQRFEAVVPVDARNHPRGPRSDVGAFQRIGADPEQRDPTDVPDSPPATPPPPAIPASGPALIPDTDADEVAQETPADQASHEVLGMQPGCGPAPVQSLLACLLCLHLLSAGARRSLPRKTAEV